MGRGIHQVIENGLTWAIAAAKIEDRRASVVEAYFGWTWTPFTGFNRSRRERPRPVVIQPVDQVKTIEGIQPGLMGIVLGLRRLRTLGVDQVQRITAEGIGGEEDARLAFHHTIDMISPCLVGIVGLSLCDVVNGPVPVQGAVVVWEDVAWGVSVGVAVEWIVPVARHVDPLSGRAGIVVDRPAIGPRRTEFRIVRDRTEDAFWASCVAVVGSDIIRSF